MADNGNGNGEEQRKAFITGVKKGIGTIKNIVKVFKRNPSVKAWAKDKRAKKRELKRDGLRGAELRQALQTWVANNPKPSGTGAKQRVQTAEDSTLVPRGTTQAVFSDAPPTQTARSPYFVLILVALGFFLLNNGKFKL
tara:strand:+ start:1179 stop:1595 length:417 start_codon:yes stop_codon:yes gene_type:complete